MIHYKEERPKQSGDWLMLRRLGSYIKPHGKLLIVAALFLAVSLAMELIRPLLLKGVIDEAFPERNKHYHEICRLIFRVPVIISMVALFIENYTLQSFGQQIIYEIRNVVFTKLISRSRHILMSCRLVIWLRVTNDTEALRTLYTDVVLKLCSSSLMIIGILISMYFLSVPLALVVSVLLPLMAVIIFVYQKYARKAFRGVRSKLAASNTSVQEMLNFIVIIKSYLGEKIMAKRYYDAVSREFLAAGLFEVKTFAIFRPIVDGLLFVAIIAIFSFTNWFDGVTEAGTVFAFLRYINKFFQPLKDIADKYNQLQSSLAGAERLVPIINEIEDVPIESVTVPDELIPVKTISFEHVYFSYNNDDNYVLKDINFTIHGGDFIGIAGPSGGGKSTLMSLLMGFYRPTKGSIRINGYDIADYAPAVIREIMGYVFQDSHLFKGTIRENITLYDTGIKDSDIQKATEQAHLHHLIERLPNGYDTPVGYLGSLLSTGQKQLLALARVLVRARSILIFDEATANIDSHTEGLIQESITRIRGEKTIISIAHRLSTIRGADCIYIIENGEISERGTYEDLMSIKGVFYTLWTTQLRNA